MSDDVTIGGCRLICGDAREFTSVAADVLLTDPPYGLPGGARHGCYQRPNAKYKHPSFFKGSTIFPGQENTLIETSVLQEYIQQVARSIIWGGHCYGLPPSPAWLVWDKQTTGQLSDCELAWTNLPFESVRRFSYLWNGFQKQHPETRWHPTQKPLALMCWCLGQIPDPIRHVIDPFAGAFTVAAACLMQGIPCTSIEIDPHYWEQGCRRVEAAYAQLDLMQPDTWHAPQQLTLA